MNILQDEDYKALLQRPIESDTQIPSTRYRRIDGIPFLIEAWKWEVIRGSTAVFLNERVAGMNDANLQKFVSEQAGVDLAGGVTVSRREIHTFLNFGFQAK